jgi:hypothetical protein
MCLFWLEGHIGVWVLAHCSWIDLIYAEPVCFCLNCKRFTALPCFNYQWIGREFFEDPFIQASLTKHDVHSCRPQENEMARAELTKAIEMFWEHNLPSPRVCSLQHPFSSSLGNWRFKERFKFWLWIYFLQCVAVDACAEPDLVNALKVSGFPEILFTNAGRIIHREKGWLYESS